MTTTAEARNERAFQTLLLSIQAARLAQANHVIDTMDAVRRDLDPLQKRSFALSIWASFSDEALFVDDLAAKVTVFARLVGYLDAATALAIAESFLPAHWVAVAIGRTRLAWRPDVRAIAIESPVAIGGGVASFIAQYLVTERGVFGRIL